MYRAHSLVCHWIDRDSERLTRLAGNERHSLVGDEVTGSGDRHVQANRKIEDGWEVGDWL